MSTFNRLRVSSCIGLIYCFGLVPSTRLSVTALLLQELDLICSKLHSIQQSPPVRASGIFPFQSAVEDQDRIERLA